MIKNHQKLMERARHIATYNNNITDNPDEVNDTTWLVEDIELVVQAIYKDLRDGRDYDEYPEDAEQFFKRHNIEAV